MATAEAAAIRKDIGNLLLYTPVVHPQEFDVAIAYLVRRLDEGASDENFMSAVFDLNSDEALFDRERQRFLNSLHIMPTEVPAPHRVQDRTQDRKSTRLNSSHVAISYAVFCLKKTKTDNRR